MREVILSPFSNSYVRDWPVDYYRILLEKLLAVAPSDILFRVIGTQAQALRARDIVRPLDAGRVFNDCGCHTWDVVASAIGRAACVIGNNSGVAHLAAQRGVPTICIFGGSHQRQEWRPVGRHVTIVSRAIWCSPCHLDRSSQCRFDKACLRGIDPEDVASAVLQTMANVGDFWPAPTPNDQADATKVG
ncbi:glycosyltransferase family 9 protein [Sphingomonas sp. 22176]|uniref:glycosyltransferase family 9 protein n=1 Tax=Sphingomonas sp. 22176 TaxID=3453884 RepID=UPI003F858B48